MKRSARFRRLQVGRYLVSVRFGWYRTGYHRVSAAMWSAACPFAVVWVLRKAVR